MKVLVTGGGGFVGGAVARQLAARGDEVVSYSRGAHPQLAAAGVRHVRGDLADRKALDEAMAGCDAVVHAAAKAGVWGPPAAYVAPNVLGTRNVVDACRRRGVPRLVFTSSPSVVHRARDLAGVDESLPYPSSYPAPYPWTKAVAERMVLAANGAGLATTALRPHLVWGPGDPNLVARIVGRARQGRLALVGSGANVIDTTYVDNAAAAHLRALDRLDDPAAAAAGRAYFVAQGEPAPLRELVDGILGAAGLPPVSRTVPARVGPALGTALERLHLLTGGRGEPLLTRFLAEELSHAHWFDLTAARRDLGYVAEVSTVEGLDRLARHLRTPPRH